jgi:phospholipase C
MNDRREFLKKAALLSGGAGMMSMLPAAIAKALAIDPLKGSTYLDAEHIVFLMQENRSFDHAYGSLQGVRGFNDPRAIRLPNKNKVWLQSTREGDTFAPFHLDIKNTKSTWMSSLPHSWSNQVDARNDGKYDKWLDAKHSGNASYRDMPLTLGYYTREDIPFYYGLADAFTVCDQNFCSSLTGTTPNRLYFWAGTIREQQNAESQANVWNEDADHDTMVSIKSFPERLEENDISWKVYQNELYLPVGFKTEEEGHWLSNFGDNPLEYLKQYNAKLSADYIDNLPASIALRKEEIKKQEAILKTQEPGSKEAIVTTARITSLQKRLAIEESDRLVYTKEKYDQLSQHEKNIHNKAFSTNKKDPNYHQLTAIKYKDGDIEREVLVPKGDVLHQFREDVQQGKLPTVSWIVAPEKYSDHPSSAWYGSWYISEVMNILTQDPEVWKKTVFVLTYDENDGYFDHVPPFVAPHPDGSNGLTSKGIDTSAEYVANSAQQSNKRAARVSPIGLGYRVPMVIASPWSRGGWVNSQVFDHTSSLQFLEHFLSHKTGKKIQEPNISNWRRAVCGNLSSVFRPYNGEKIELPTPVKKEPFIETIHKAQFKDVPSNFSKLSPENIANANKQADTSFLPQQEKGIRSSNALPYELYCDCHIESDKRSVSITMLADSTLFGTRAAGSAFQVFAPGKYKGEPVRVWDYATAPGDMLRDVWEIADFEKEQYHLRVYGPNGFYREFIGNNQDPELTVQCGYERDNLSIGNVVIRLINKSQTPLTVQISDNAYGTGSRTVVVPALRVMRRKKLVTMHLQKSFGWYDLSVRVKGNDVYQQSFAGRVETGQPSKTDPLMGRIL